MKKYIILTLVFTAQTFLTGCIAGPSSPLYQKEMRHMNEYHNKDQTERNKFHQKQAIDDLSGCPILIRMGKWEYETRWSSGSWIRDQSFMYPSGMVSEESVGINSTNYTYPKNAIFVYIGPWKDINLEYGPFWNKTKISKKIRFTAIQKKNDRNKGYIYASYEFMTPQNKNIKEKPLTIPQGEPDPNFKRLCEVRWVAKHGYNTIFDTKTRKLTEAKK